MYLEQQCTTATFAIAALTHNYTIKEHKELWYKKGMKRWHKYHWRQHLGFHTKSHGEEACGNHVKIDRNPCINLANDIKSANG